MRLLPPPPRTQALSSDTFRPPPLDGSLTLPEIYDWHMTNTPNHRLFVYASEDGQSKDIFWPQAVRAIHVGARIMQQRITIDDQPDSEAPVVAILAASDTISYFINLMAILRAGFIAFPISPRNSPAAVAYLVDKVKVQHILVGEEPSLQGLLRDSIDLLKVNHASTPVPKTTSIPLFPELFSEEQVNLPELTVRSRGQDDTLFYLHSSGSTAFPKPISWSNYRAIQLALIPYFGEQDLTGQVLSLHSMPMYHGMGILQLFWTAASGLVISAFEPKSPATIPTPDRLFRDVVATNSDIVFCVPAFVEAWSRNPEYVKWLAGRNGILFGGGPLNKEAGDAMVSQGVSIYNLYGFSEAGILSPILPKKGDHEWEYIRFTANSTPKMVPYDKNVFELVLPSSTFCTPSVVNYTLDGVECYASSDLFEPHPSRPGYWRVYGRSDDQIMHNTGEKTNPGPLENILNQDPHVQSSVMFGRGRFQAGVLIDPKPQYKFDDGDDVQLSQFRNMIWPTIVKMNEYAPQHSRLFKEMIIVAKSSKPFQYTAKNTARRQAIINDYEEEIDALYQSVKVSTQPDIPHPDTWDISSITHFVRAVVQKLMMSKIKDSESIFDYGCDSLQATWIRNTLLRAVKDVAKADTRKNTDNFVYSCASISNMAHFLHSMASGTIEVQASVAERLKAMSDMVGKYTTKLPIHRPSIWTSMHSGGRVVVLTGTTGALGSYLLEQLVADPTVSRVYAFNRLRQHGTSIVDVQRNALVDRGIDESMLMSDKVNIVEVDLNQINFRLPRELFYEIHASTTHIIHNAWPVDFNYSLQSFEPSIAGLRRLIDFCLTSPRCTPPKFIFTSTIGIFRKPSQSKMPESLVPAEVSLGTGYSESKWVSEQILNYASRQRTIQTTTVRVGQLSGGPNGSWNGKEWFPSMIQASMMLGCLPEDNKLINWIPIDTAAKAIVDFLSIENVSRSSNIVHLVHPNPIPWSTVASHIASAFSLSVVPYKDWLERLEKRNTAEDEDAIRYIPAMKILPFFKEIGDNEGSRSSAFGFPDLSVTNAVSSSSTLAYGGQTAHLFGPPNFFDRTPQLFGCTSPLLSSALPPTFLLLPLLFVQAQLSAPQLFLDTGSCNHILENFYN